jgi:hypothetical protein
MWQETAALREFGLTYVGSGSFTSHRYGRDSGGMSAIAPIATELVRRNQLTRSAKTGPSASQQRVLLFDHLVGEGEQLVWKRETERLRGPEIDH